MWLMVTAQMQLFAQQVEFSDVLYDFVLDENVSYKIIHFMRRGRQPDVWNVSSDIKLVDKQK
jgi:hypothetical protein